jgi:hypothetical protein
MAVSRGTSAPGFRRMLENNKQIYAYSVKPFNEAGSETPPYMNCDRRLRLRLPTATADCLSTATADYRPPTVDWISDGGGSR